MSTETIKATPVGGTIVVEVGDRANYGVVTVDPERTPVTWRWAIASGQSGTADTEDAAVEDAAAAIREHSPAPEPADVEDDTDEDEEDEEDDEPLREYRVTVETMRETYVYDVDATEAEDARDQAAALARQDPRNPMPVGVYFSTRVERLS